jgi:molybdenum cofactor sulfurtransferase
VFTRSATGALQLIGEMFPWSGGSQYAYLRSNHKSVLGIREYAKRGGAALLSIREEEVEAWLASDDAKPAGAQGGSSHAAANGTADVAATSGSANGGGGEPAYSLFAFPAYDNFSGKMNPAEWVKAVQAKSTPGHQWKVIWDTAAYAPCHPINLAEVPADFICLSFYKLFGYPTGVGALIMRRDMAARMRKVFWGGGSANFTVSSLDWSLLSDGPERFEDGTLPFIEILALKYGLQVFDTLGGLAAIEAHVEAVGRFLYEQVRLLGSRKLLRGGLPWAKFWCGMATFRPCGPGVQALAWLWIISQQRTSTWPSRCPPCRPPSCATATGHPS